jgi:hypothetical protein
MKDLITMDCCQAQPNGRRTIWNITSIRDNPMKETAMQSWIQLSLTTQFKHASPAKPELDTAPQQSSVLKGCTSFHTWL